MHLLTRFLAIELERERRAAAARRSLARRVSESGDAPRQTVRRRLAVALARADVDLAPDDAVRLWLLAVVVLAGLGAAVTTVAAMDGGLVWSRFGFELDAATPPALRRQLVGLADMARLRETITGGFGSRLAMYMCSLWEPGLIPIVDPMRPL